MVEDPNDNEIEALRDQDQEATEGSLRAIGDLRTRVLGWEGDDLLFCPPDGSFSLEEMRETAGVYCATGAAQMAAQSIRCGVRPSFYVLFVSNGQGSVLEIEPDLYGSNFREASEIAHRDGRFTLTNLCVEFASVPARRPSDDELPY